MDGERCGPLFVNIMIYDFPPPWVGLLSIINWTHSPYYCLNLIWYLLPPPPLFLFFFSWMGTKTSPCLRKTVCGISMHGHRQKYAWMSGPRVMSQWAMWSYKKYKNWSGILNIWIVSIILLLHTRGMCLLDFGFSFLFPFYYLHERKWYTYNRFHNFFFIIIF